MKIRKKKIIISIVLLATIGLVVAGFLVFAPNSPKDMLQEKLDLGRQYISGFEYEQALAVYQEALEIEPNSAKARLGILAVYMNMGKEEEALLFCEETLARLDDSETEDGDDMASLYMYVQQLYGDEPEQLLSILAKGYDATNGYMFIQNAFGQNAQAYIYALLQKGEIQKAQSFLQEKLSMETIQKEIEKPTS